MKLQHFFLFLIIVAFSANRASANDSLRFTVTNLPCTDHYAYLNNGDSSKGSYDTLFSRGDYLLVFDSLGHFEDTTYYTIKAQPQAQLHIVFTKIAGLISYVHFTSGPIIGTKAVTFELRNVMQDLTRPPTYFQLHGDTLGGHSFSFVATYHFFTSGGYSENSYVATGEHRDSTLFTFSLNHEIPTASASQPSALSSPLIYPNPASSVIHVWSPENSDTDLNLFDVTGKKLYTARSVGQSADIGISSLPNGTYLLRREHWSKCVLIQH